MSTTTTTTRRVLTTYDWSFFVRRRYQSTNQRTGCDHCTYCLLLEDCFAVLSDPFSSPVLVPTVFAHDSESGPSHKRRRNNVLLPRRGIHRHDRA